MLSRLQKILHKQFDWGDHSWTDWSRQEEVQVDPYTNRVWDTYRQSRVCVVCGHQVFQSGGKKREDPDKEIHVCRSGWCCEIII